MKLTHLSVRTMVFRICFSAALTVLALLIATYVVTKSSAAVIFVLVTSLAMSLFGAMIMQFFQKKLAVFTAEICATLDEMIDGTAQLKQNMEEETVMKYSFNVADGQEAAMSAFLKDYTENVDPSVAYFFAELATQSAESTRSMISFVGGVIGAIFGIAGIINLINMLITSILTRRHEFATMQSIGMTKKQLAAMVTFESVYYALLASACGILLAAVVGGTAVKNFCATQWNFTYHMTLLPVVCVCLVLLAAAVIVPLLAIKMFHRESITEQLRHAE